MGIREYNIREKLALSEHKKVKKFENVYRIEGKELLGKKE